MSTTIYSSAAAGAAIDSMAAKTINDFGMVPPVSICAASGQGPRCDFLI
jgi:hypothetical protein